MYSSSESLFRCSQWLRTTGPIIIVTRKLTRRLQRLPRQSLWEIASLTDGLLPILSFFSDNNFVGRGISGQVTSQMLLRFRQDVIDLHPKYVVILAGTNDIAENSGKIDMEKTFGNIVSMCDLAKANGIKPIICSVIPAASFYWHPHVTGAAEKIVQLNAMLEAYAKANRIKYVDYHSAMKDERGGLPESLAKDGVHPTREGYDIMKNLLLKAL